MIRDPSDGTIKEISPEANQINAVATKTATKEIGPDTGIRQPTRTDAMQRLEKSRTWLKDYQERKRKEYANAGGSNGEERSTDGDSSNDQRQAEPGLSGIDRPDSRAHRQG